MSYKKVRLISFHRDAWSDYLKRGDRETLNRMYRAHFGECTRLEIPQECYSSEASASKNKERSSAHKQLNVRFMGALTVWYSATQELTSGCAYSRKSSNQSPNNYN